MDFQKELSSLEQISQASEFVKINPAKIKEFGDNFQKDNINHWLSEAPFDFSKLNDEEKLNFLLVFNSLSFSYWGEPKWTVEYDNQKFDGSWAMIVALRRAIEEGKPILNTEYRAQISEQEFTEILRGNIEIPLFKERFNILKEIANGLIKNYSGDFSRLLEKSNRDSATLVDLIVSEFPSFNDSSEYKGAVIHFNKRAQLLVADIFQLFAGVGYGEFSGIENLLGCADYKIPQIMRKLGILEFSPELSEKVDNKIEIAHNSHEEIEIRANQLWAIELIREQLGGDITRVHINDHLWLASQTKSPDDKPYHRTRTTAY